MKWSSWQRYFALKYWKLPQRYTILYWDGLPKFPPPPQVFAKIPPIAKMWNFRSNCAYNSHVFQGLDLIIQKHHIMEGEKVRKVPYIIGAIWGGNTFLGFWNQIYTTIQGKKVRNLHSVLGAIWGKITTFGCFFFGGEGIWQKPIGGWNSNVINLFRYLELIEYVQYWS